MAIVTPFTEEQARALINLDQRYEVWIEAERILASLAYGMQRKTIEGRDYLYEISDRKGNGRSLGPWDEDKGKILEDYKQQKSIAKDRSAQSKAKLDETAALARALRLPLLASETGPILREADKRSLLGNSLLVVGTNAIAAYAVEAGGTIRDLPTETEDIDLAWTRTQLQDQEQTIWNMLKAVDPTFTVNTERTFQARNAKAYEVEILVAPSRAGGMARTDRPWPVPLAEQEWLLNAGQSHFRFARVDWQGRRCSSRRV